jgi:hypothetical protein
VLPPRVLTGICVLVAVVWAVSTFYDMASSTYEPDPAINAIFGGTIGTALAIGRKEEQQKGRRR